MQPGALFNSIIQGQVVSVDVNAQSVQIVLPLTQSKTKFTAPLPASWRGPKGEFSGGYIARGTPVYCEKTQGGQYVVLGFGTPDSLGGLFDALGNSVVNLSKLTSGRWATLITNDIHIIADPDQGILTGDSNQFTQFDPITKIVSSRFDYGMDFTEGGYSLSGVVFRDIAPNSVRQLNDPLTSHEYQNTLKEIGLDPSTVTGRAYKSNPALAENRSVVYEFEKSFDYTNDSEEIKAYNGANPPQPAGFSRYNSRADAFSITLDEPNILIQKVEGTGVDIYGNVLDLNRSKLPNGEIDPYIFSKASDTNKDTFERLRAQLRKSIGVHYELNARKEGFDLRNYDGYSFDGYSITGFSSGQNTSYDYARSRSRFSFDMDKEGQIKINVPSSSEEGNVSLLTRAENYSALYGAKNNTDRNLFLSNDTNTDIYLEAYGQGCVALTSTDPHLVAYAAPIDRITNTQISLGTGFHNLQKDNFLQNIPAGNLPISGYPDSFINSLPPLNNIVSPNMIVSGVGANAGGRSATIALDGMLSLSIGANTIDRQSLWLDLAGGLVASIGRDGYYRSATLQCDGDVIVQIGSSTISNDSRFSDSGIRDGTLDIRIMNSGSMHVIRIDSQGLTIHTPQRIDIVSEGDLRLKSIRGDVHIDGENIFMYSGMANGGRLVERANGSEIG
jgi:hypothetical protein